MKKLALFLAALMIAIGFFGTIGGNNAEAEKAAFGQDDLETVKQLSLEFLRQRMPERGIAADDSNFRVTKVFIDDLNMGHISNINYQFFIMRAGFTVVRKIPAK